MRADAQAALSAAVELAEQVHDELLTHQAFQPWTFRDRLGYLLGTTGHAYTLWNTTEALRTMDAADRLSGEVEAFVDALDAGEGADDAELRAALAGYGEARRSMIAGATNGDQGA